MGSTTCSRSTRRRSPVPWSAWRRRFMPDPVKKTTWLRWAIDGAPACAFLAVLLVTHDFRLATWWLVGAAALALIVGLVAERRFAPLPAVIGGTALVFGGLSLVLHRNDILQMKMTIVDAALGALLFGGLLVKKNPLK